MIARGPNRKPDDPPDVDGTVVRERPDGMVEVQEKGHFSRTIVNPAGGWLVLVASAMALAYIYWPDSTYT